jgi:hypothetical protein
MAREPLGQHGDIWAGVYGWNQNSISALSLSKRAACSTLAET